MTVNWDWAMGLKDRLPPGATGWRFSIANSGVGDLREAGYIQRASYEMESFAGADWAPLVSPWWSRPWPAGWVTAVCDEGCIAVPGYHCGCGVTYMDRPEELVWYLLRGSGRSFITNHGDRVAIARFDLRGGTVSQDSPGHPSFERRASEGRVAELWLPRKGERYAQALEEFYGVPVNVGDEDGQDWLHALAPVIPDVPALPEPDEELNPIKVLTEAIALLRTFKQTPQRDAAIARSEKTIKGLIMDRQASLDVQEAHGQTA